MTQEEKQLLLKDISARFPYKVFVKWKTARNPAIVKNIGDEKLIIYREYSDFVYAWECCIEDIKPYLRPMSSMTEEEYGEYENYILNEKDEQIRFCNSLNFYGRHHFDYRGLIEKGLALEAPEGMYMSYNEKHPTTEDMIKKKR